MRGLALLTGAVILNGFDGLASLLVVPVRVVIVVLPSLIIVI